MGKNKGRKRDTYEKGGYFAVGWKLLDSYAFRDLSPAACKVYLLLGRRYNSVNNGLIQFGIEDAENFAGLSLNTVKRALKELIEKGLIEKTKRGVYRGNKSEWLLTSRPDDRQGYERKRNL